MLCTRNKCRNNDGVCDNLSLTKKHVDDSMISWKVDSGEGEREFEFIGCLSKKNFDLVIL